jgi:hypothetical protein
MHFAINKDGAISTVVGAQRRNRRPLWRLWGVLWGYIDGLGAFLGARARADAAVVLSTAVLYDILDETFEGG